MTTPILRPEVARLVASMREILNLCAIGDCDETTEALGWGLAIREAKAAIKAVNAIAHLSASAPRAQEARQSHEPSSLALAVRWLEKRRDDYLNKYGYVEPDTGALSFGRGDQGRQREECYYEMEEVIDGVKVFLVPAHPAHEGGEDGELPEPDVPDIIAGALQVSRGYAYTLMERALASRAQPAAASAAVRDVHADALRAKLQTLLSNARGYLDMVTLPSLSRGHRESSAERADRESMEMEHDEMLRQCKADLDEQIAALAAAPDVPPAGVAQAAPVDALPELREAFAHALTSVYVCGRVWSAWSYGTMTEEDFTPGAECDELLDGLVHVAAQAPVRATPRVEAKPLTDDEAAQVFETTSRGFGGLSHRDCTIRFVRAVEREFCKKNGIGKHPEADKGQGNG